MKIARKFTVPAYWPRSDPRSVRYHNAALDIVYTVHSDQPGNVVDNTPRPRAVRRMNVLFLNGGQFTKESYQFHVEMLQAEFGPTKLGKCIAVDHVLNGDSAVLNEGKAAAFVVWEDHARDAAVVIRDCLRRREISLDEPLIVIGHSMGGAAAIALSVFEPALVAGLVLIDPTILGDVNIADHPVISPVSARIARSAYRNAQDRFVDFAAYQHYMDKVFISSTAHPRIKQDMADNNYLLLPDGSVRFKASAAFQAGPYYSSFTIMGVGQSLARRIRAPTLLIHGEIFNFNPPADGELLENLIRESGNPLVRRTLIANADHNVCFTHPVETIDAAKGFIRKACELFYDRVEQSQDQYSASVDERFAREIDAMINQTGPDAKL